MAFVTTIASTTPQRRRMQTRNPITGEALMAFDVATAEDVEAALARARAAQPGWAALSFSQRGAFLQKALSILTDRRQEFIDRLVAETGRSRMETSMIEIFAACDSLNFFSRRAEKILKDRTVSLHILKLKRAKLVYRPLGVVGVISPWNGPFILSINPTIQALMAGNAVLIKPSEVTPEAGVLVSELFAEAGLPDGLVQVLLGDGETGAALVNSKIDKISFTGSVRTGRKVGEACGRNLVPCTLELGGKDAMIVCDDADVARAAGGAVFGGLMNGGQFCSATERIYVTESVSEAFVEAVVEKVRALRQTEDVYDIGPFIFERQLAIVEEQIADAREKGASVLVGGARNEDLRGHWYQPTVLVDVTHDMKVMTEETFGPILPIVVVRDTEEAIAMANDSEYGLAATVWTRDRAQGERIARRLDVGSVIINETSITYGALELPFGGRRSSGVGHVNGASGLRGYCHALPILSDRFGQKEEMVWYPHSPDKVDKIDKAIHWLWKTPLKYLM